jgi:hypothetical protein
MPDIAADQFAAAVAVARGNGFDVDRLTKTNHANAVRTAR